MLGIIGYGVAAVLFALAAGWACAEGNYALAVANGVVALLDASVFGVRVERGW